MQLWPELQAILNRVSLQPCALYLGALGRELWNSFFFAVKALKRAEGGAEDDREWMDSRSGSTAGSATCSAPTAGFQGTTEVSSSVWGPPCSWATFVSILPQGWGWGPSFPPNAY
jgi:hypothetical protein